jgi:hypothetical protein
MKHDELKAIVKDLNDLDIEGIAKLRVVGIKGSVLEENFLSAVDAVDDAGRTDMLPESIIAAYNALSVDDGTEGEAEGDAERDAEEAPEGKPAKEMKEKKEKAPKEKKPAKKAEPRSRYGHVPSAVSGELDDLMFAGNTVTTMMKELGVNRTRVVNHAKHLINDKGLTVVITVPKGEDVKLNDTHYQVTEATWTKD